MIVVIWTGAASLGALIALWNLGQAWLDLRALGTDTNGRRLLAVGYVRSEAIRLFVQVTWALIGFGSLGQPSTISLVALLLVATALAIALNTILDARDRIALRRILT